MKLIFIYGPPAAGKLTVAQALAKLTSYKIFHNHLTVDLILSIFDWGTPSFSKFVKKYRLELIEAAARENIAGLIFTYVYARTRGDDVFIKSIVQRVEKYNGVVHFVQLRCDIPELQRRIRQPSRKKYMKKRTAAFLRKITQSYDLFSPVRYERNLYIDNTKLSAKSAARQIAEHYKLQEKKP